MHGSAGLHSALAIKRQRRLREQAKKRTVERERRLSSSTASIDSEEPHRPVTKRKITAPPDHGLASSVGMLHLGVCFLVLGIFLIGSGILPDDVITWRTGGWWNELITTGVFVTCLGVFLIILNSIVGKKEEDDLNEYVQRQLTRSRSGHRLERDVETGCLTTKHHRKVMEQKREGIERGLDDSDLPSVHSPQSKTNPNNVVFQNGDAHLERILEEEVFERPDDNQTNQFEYARETVSTNTTASMSPATPSETQELLTNSRHHHTGRV